MIEDNEDDASLTLMALERSGFDLKSERVANMADLTDALSRRPDAIVADYSVPGLDVRDAIDTALAAMPDIPVIVVSGSMSAETGVELMRRGAQDYLSKMALERLGAALQKGLDRAGERRRLRSAETDYQQLFNHLPVGVIRNLPSGATLQMNRAFLEILRFPDEATYRAEVSAEAGEFISGKDRATIVAQLAQSGVARGIEVLVRRHDRTQGWVQLDLRATVGADGAVTSVDTVVTDIDDRKRAEAALEASAEKLRQSDAVRQLLLERLINAQEEERKRIALDIHDDAVQVMTAASIRLVLLGQKLDDGRLNVEVDRLVDSVTQSTVRLRNLMFELQPPALERHGLVAALRMALEMLTSDTTIQHVITGSLEQEPSQESGVVIYRIFQEALANVRRHSKASSVEVSVTNAGADICISVADNGIGFSKPLHELDEKIVHLGLASMNERAYLAGGRWTIVSTPGQGTRVDFRVPVAARASAGTPLAVA
ncbi:MAG: hypothetical protein NVSMB17_03240 [Candidatus Dormibacteria bacterium]